METKKQSPNPYKGAIFLAIASVIVKLLSAIYKVPFQNLTGDAGFYVYQQIYPFYGIAIVFSFSGVPLYISKLVSEARTDRKSTRLNSSHVSISYAVFCL